MSECAKRTINAILYLKVNAALETISKATTYQLCKGLRRHGEQYASLILSPHHDIRPCFTGLPLEKEDQVSDHPEKF